MPEVVIIGAGPAGSVAAALLATAGGSVTIIEQHRFPRDKVCGECLSDLCIETLTRLGLRQEVEQCRPTVLRRATIDAGGRVHECELPSPMLGLSRGKLDSLLLQIAKRRGAKVLQPARCERIESNPLRVHVRELDTNRLITPSPDCVLIADGKSKSSTGDFGIKAHFDGIRGPCHTIGLFGCRAAYAGLAPIEDGRWNVACSVPGGSLRRRGGNIECVFQELVRQNHSLARRLEGSRRIGHWLAAPLPRFGVGRDWKSCIPIGNSAAAIEPIGGEGIGLAVRSGELAAKWLIEQRPVEWLRDEYRRLWDVRRLACRTAGLVVATPGAARLVLPILNGAGPVANLGLALMGK